MQYEGVPTPGEQIIPNARNLIKIVILFTLLLIAFVGGHYGAISIEEAMGNTELLVQIIKWSWLLFWGTLASIALQGLGILGHDAVHKALFKNKWANEIIGTLVSTFALLPFSSNRQFHLTHHRFSHQKNLDPEQPMHNHPLWFSITIGSAIGLAIQYKILTVNIFTRLFNKRYFISLVLDILFLSFAICIYFIILPANGIPVEHSLVPMYLALPVVFGIRAISDHYGLPAAPTKEERTSNSNQNDVHGWVIMTSPLIEWLWSNVNYHEVHHKFPYLSYVYLKPAFHATRDDIPYIVANGYLRNLWRHLKRDYYNPEIPKSD